MSIGYCVCVSKQDRMKTGHKNVGLGRENSRDYFDAGTNMLTL